MVCLFPLVAWSQDAHVVGHISDENNKPMPFVSVQLKGTTLGGLSDETGHYFLNDLPVGEQTLVISWFHPSFLRLLPPIVRPMS